MQHWQQFRQSAEELSATHQALGVVTNALPATSEKIDNMRFRLRWADTHPGHMDILFSAEMLYDLPGSSREAHH